MAGLYSIVTPHVGVWIETSDEMYSRGYTGVTPHVGVWIETLTRRRSPKHFEVTPHVGVWIETDFMALDAYPVVSHLM